MLLRGYEWAAKYGAPTNLPAKRYVGNEPLLASCGYQEHIYSLVPKTPNFPNMKQPL